MLRKPQGETVTLEDMVRYVCVKYGVCVCVCVKYGVYGVCVCIKERMCINACLCMCI